MLVKFVIVNLWWVLLELVGQLELFECVIFANQLLVLLSKLLLVIVKPHRLDSRQTHLINKVANSDLQEIVTEVTHVQEMFELHLSQADEVS